MGIFGGPDVKVEKGKEGCAVTGTEIAENNGIKTTTEVCANKNGEVERITVTNKAEGSLIGNIMAGRQGAGRDMASGGQVVYANQPAAGQRKLTSEQFEALISGPEHEDLRKALMKNNVTQHKEKLDGNPDLPGPTTYVADLAKKTGQTASR